MTSRTAAAILVSLPLRASREASIANTAPARPSQIAARRSHPELIDGDLASIAEPDLPVEIADMVCDVLAKISTGLSQPDPLSPGLRPGDP